MSSERTSSGGLSDDQDLYEEMLRLEQLESLLEEIEEIGADDTANLPSELRVRLASLSLTNTQELRRRVEFLHASLDAAEKTLPHSFP